MEGAGGNACPKRLEPEALEKISNLLIEASEHCACVLIWPDATASVTFVPQAATEEVLPQNFIAAAVAELLRDEALFTAALRKAVGETLQ